MAGQKIISTTIKKDSRHDTLAAVDVYGTSNPTEAVNNIIPKSVTKLITPKSKQNNILGEIKAAISTGSPIEKLANINDIYNRVDDALKGSRSGLNSMSTQNLKSILGALNLEDTTLGKITIAGKTYTNVKNKNAQSTMRFLQAVLGDEVLAEYFDGNSMFALLKVGIEMAQELGIPELVQKLLDKAADNRLKIKLMVETLPNAVRTSNISTVKKILNEISIDKAFSIMPDIIESLVQYYRIPLDNKRSIDDLRHDVVEVLDKLDPKWDKGKLNGVEVYSLERIYGASNDFIALWPGIDTVNRNMYTVNPEDSYTPEQKQYLQRAMILNHSKSVRMATAYQLVRNAYPKGRFVGIK